MSAAIVAQVLATTFALMTPLAYASFGEIVGQRSGIVNLGIEGEMLLGAASGFVAAVVTGNALVGLLVGAGVGMGVNLLFAALVVLGRTNQLATGFAFYFIGLAASSILGERYIGSSVNGIGTLNVPGFSSLPAPWNTIFQQDAVVWLVVPTAIFIWWLLAKTRWGVYVRSVGEDRVAAFAAGLRPSRLQFQALGIAGALSGLAGAELAIDYTKTWQDGIINGRGFIAICIVMLALWNPLRAILGSVLFSLAYAIALQLQASGSSIQPDVLNMLPYVLTILVVIAWARPTQYSAPAGLREVFSGTSK
jgi:simple sugar transport system permease protein